jgi:hypothetical protein
MSDHTKRVLRALAVIALAHAAFIGLTVLTDHQQLFDLLSAILLCIAVAVIFAYWPIVWDIALYGLRDRADYLALGIWLSWYSIAFMRAFLGVYYQLGQPAWMIQTEGRNYYLTVGIIAGTLHIIRTRVHDNKVPTPEWVRVGMIAGVGVGIALAISWFF